MNLIDEYRLQATWRDWNSYLDILPVKKSDIILDLGCSLGTVTRLLSLRASTVIGVDYNTELLKEASLINTSENITYVFKDLINLSPDEFPIANGIWTSFVPAYFPDFEPVLKRWISLLNPGGWIALVEMAGLYDHDPLPSSVKEVFSRYYERQKKNNLYDFQMGNRIRGIALNSGLSIIHEENKPDRELTFNGPAEPRILKAWESRFERMTLFREYTGESDFQEIRHEFLNCLKNKDHTSQTIIKFVIGQSV